MKNFNEKDFIDVIDQSAEGLIKKLITIVLSCLTLNEQKQLLKRVGLSIKQKSHFEIHEILVTDQDFSSRSRR